MKLKLDGRLQKANYSFLAVALHAGEGECNAYDDEGILVGKFTQIKDGIKETRMFNGKLFQHFDGESWRTEKDYGKQEVGK